MTERYSLIGLSLINAHDAGSATASLLKHFDSLQIDDVNTVINLLLPVLAYKMEQTPKEVFQTLWEALPDDDEWNEEWVPMIKKSVAQLQN